uniref:Villin-3 n=1 Tax=Rhizophora mucronata TaxID=61149 RepID=A0A2P2MLR8_RHIMU
MITVVMMMIWFGK